MPTHARMRSSGRPRAVRVVESISRAYRKPNSATKPEREQQGGTYDMAQDILMNELTAPKLTLMPHKRVALMTTRSW